MLVCTHDSYDISTASARFSENMKTIVHMRNCPLCVLFMSQCIIQYSNVSHRASGCLKPPVSSCNSVILCENRWKSIYNVVSLPLPIYGRHLAFPASQYIVKSSHAFHFVPNPNIWGLRLDFRCYRVCWLRYGFSYLLPVKGSHLWFSSYIAHCLRWSHGVPGPREHDRWNCHVYPGVESWSCKIHRKRKIDWLIFRW